jgi:hypothetical protein
MRYLFRILSILTILFITIGFLRVPASGQISQALASNSGWEEVSAESASGGGISNNNGTSNYSSIAIDSNQIPYIVWSDSSDGDSEIYVRRWNGNSWEEVGSGSASGGGISNNSGVSNPPSIAIDADNVPYVTWSDLSGGDAEIYIRRWKNSSWEEVGTGSASGGGISDNSGSSYAPSIAIGPDKLPYVCWYDFSAGNYEIYIRRWNGSSWEEVGAGSAGGGGISNNSGNSYSPSIVIGTDNLPYVSWDDYSNGDSEIYVRHWNGSTWEEVGAGSASGGGISDNSGSSYSSSIALSPENDPMVTWNDTSTGDSEIYVRRWNGNSWAEVGTGSASGGGISNNNGESYAPTIAFGADKMPYIAWWDDSLGNFEIYVRRWNGNTWEEVLAGSASGGGISNNAGRSEGPSIGAGGLLYITWFDDSNGNTEIYVRRYLDTIPPSAIIDLSASTSLTPGAVDLSWMAPGNDGDSGTAFAYIMRYNTAQISEINWDASTDVNGEPTPELAGTIQNMTVGGLVGGQTYYFALKTQDQVPNTSSLSNSPHAAASYYLLSLPMLTCPLPAPAAPILNAINNPDGEHTYTVTWSSVTHAAEYLLQRATQDDFSDAVQAYLGAATYSNESGRGPTRYYYRVLARNVSGDSPWSNSQQVDVLWELEPNTLYTDANGPLISGLDYQGWHNDTSDYFRIYVPSAGTIHITLTTEQTGKDGQGNYYVRLLLYEGTPDSTAEGDDPTLPYSITYSGAAGWYYIRVYTAAGGVDPDKSYTLTVTYP